MSNPTSIDRVTALHERVTASIVDAIERGAGDWRMPWQNIAQAGTPPQTKPPTDGSPSSTAASPAIWENFDDFYSKTMAAAMTAFEAGQAADADKFKAQLEAAGAKVELK